MIIGSRTERRIASFKLRKIRWHRICILFAVVLLAGTLASRFPPANAIPSSATSCISTECAISPKVSSSLPSGLGDIVSEVKFDQSTGYSDGQTTAYGGTNPNIWIGLGASLNNNARSIQNPLYNFRVLQINVAITDSSGNQFPLNSNTITTSVWDAPYPSGITIDYAQLIGELSNFLVGLLGVPTPPNIPISQPTPNGNYIVSNTLITQWTGYPNPCYIDSSFHNTCTGGGGALYDKFLRVKLVPTFTIPGVYKITIGTQVERGECYQNVSSNDRVISYYDYCYTQETQTQSYSFNYVYENDAAKGIGDAADSLPNAGGSPSFAGHGTNNGFLYGIDTQDVYSFTATQGEKISFTVTPPATADFGLTLYDNNQVMIQTRDLGIGATNGVAFTASIGGTYFANIFRTSGWGTYSFTLSDSFSISANPSNVNLGLAGTSSSPTSTITVSSPTDFAGKVDLSTSVSPSVANGPTASISTVTITETLSGTVVLSPSSYSNPYWNPVNPSNAYAKDGAYADFDSNNGGAGGITSVEYGGYSTSLPSGATITSVYVEAWHYETTYGRFAGSTFIAVRSPDGALSSYVFPPYRSSETNDTLDVTSLYPGGWTQSAISTAHMFYGTEGGYFVSHLDWLALIVHYNYPHTYTTSSVTLTAGSSDTRVLTITSNANTPAGVYTVTVTGITTGGISFSAPVAATVQDFQVTATPTFLTISPGQSATTTITVSPLNGFTGSVTLFVSAPARFTTGFSTNVISGGSGTSALTISLSGTPTPDPATITVSGSTGGRTQSAIITVLNPPPDFSVSASPNPITMPAGQSTTLTVTVTSLYGFTGTVSLTENGPPGLTCTALNPATVTLTSTTTSAPSSVSCAAPTGVYTLNVTGTSGSTSRYALAPFTFQDFSISTNPSSINNLMNTWGSSTVTIGSQYGFSGAVSLSLTVSPSSGLYCTLSVGVVYGAGSSTLSCEGSPGTYTVTVTGTSGSLVHSVPVTYTVKGFTITISPSSISTPEGRTVSATVTATSVNGYSGSVSLSPNISCASYSLGSSSLQVPSPGSSSTMLYITPSTSCSAANWSDSVSGTDTSLGISGYGYLTLATSDFSGSMQYPTFGIRVGTTITDNINIYSNNGYSGTIRVSTYIQGNTCCASWGAQNGQVALSSGGSVIDPVTFTATAAAFNGYTVMNLTDGYIVRTARFWVNFNDYNATIYSNPVTVYIGSSTANYLQIYPYFGIPLTNETVVQTSVSNSCVSIGTPSPKYFNVGTVIPYSFITLPVSASSTCTAGNVQATVTITGVTNHAYDKAITFNISVQTAPSGGGGGSVAAGTLITLADGTQVPVQSLRVGMQLLSYDMAAHQYVITTITRFVTVMTRNQMVISTSTGKPLIVDQNPAQKLYVKTPDGTVTLMSVTDLKVGYDLFDAISQTWVPITSIHYENGGNHLMYDIYPTSPGNYIANGYLDPWKN